MAEKTPFGSEKVIIQHISKTNLKTYFVDFDITDNNKIIYRWKNLINLLQKTIPEFAFGHHNGTSINLTEITDLLCNAAKAIYNIKEFKETKDIYLNGGHIADDDVEMKYLRLIDKQALD